MRAPSTPRITRRMPAASDRVVRGATPGDAAGGGAHATCGCCDGGELVGGVEVGGMYGGGGAGGPWSGDDEAPGVPSGVGTGSVGLSWVI
jgi:hypothetical protein